MQLLNGKELSLKIKEDIKKKIKEDYLDKGKDVPGLAVVLVGDDPASQIYVKNKEKACEYVGIKSRVVKMPQNSTQEEVLEQIKLLNQDNQINGVLVQLPLPKHLNETEIIQSILPSKDVDCLTYENKGKLVSGTNIIAPCTPSGIIELLHNAEVEISGKNAVIIGRSQLVGRPVEILLNRLNATTTICHSKTENIEEVCKRADILVVATGKPNFVGKEFVKENSVVIDVGINRTEEGKIVGDCNYSEVCEIASKITPVPGGVGPMTIAMLLKNTLILAENCR